MACKLKLAVGQRTEMAINVRTDDGLTNSASNIIKFTQLSDETKPSGLVWVQFDYEDVGKKPDGKTEIFTVEVLKVLGHQ